MSKRWALAASSLMVVAVVLGTAGVVAADQLVTIEVPAPVSQAEGIGLDVGGVVGVGHTGTATGPTAGDAVANAVEVGGQPIIGGSQSGPGENSGALLDTGQTPLGRLELAPWQAKVTEDADARQAEAAAAAARANLIDPDVASVDVLQSSSSSTHEGLVSSALATSDVLVVNLGGPTGVTVRLLHSESNSSGKGLTYVLAINDMPIISVDQLSDQICALDLPEVLEVSCLAVTGGVGNVTSEVLNATVGGANGLTAKAVSASGSGGAGVSASSTDLPATEVKPNVVTRTAAPVGGLPRMGSEILFAASFAVALMALGMVLVGLRRMTLVPAPARIR